MLQRISHLNLTLLKKPVKTNIYRSTQRFVNGVYSDSEEEIQLEKNRCTLLFALEDEPGSLESCLRILRKNGINMTRIESKLFKLENAVNFFVDVDLPSDHKRVKRAVNDLQNICKSAEIIGSKKVPWFPISAADVDMLANHVLDGGSDLQADHPGFHDEEYKKRRQVIADFAFQHSYGDKIQPMDYTVDEKETWHTIWNTLKPLLNQYACDEYIEALKLFDYQANDIPQLCDINEVVYARTGFRMRPCAGLLSARDFLYGLAFRIFFSTQYIRHHTRPLYTPEPDLVHELVGHAPLFADPDFAAFSQAIGMAAIGATDEQVIQLARCYWFSVEFGLCGVGNERKAYGAGLLSSFGELTYSMGSEPQILDWDPFQAAQLDYPITTYQPTYFKAQSFSNAKDKMIEFADSLNLPFSVRWNADTETIEVDRNVARV